MKPKAKYARNWSILAALISISGIIWNMLASSNEQPFASYEMLVASGFVYLFGIAFNVGAYILEEVEKDA